VKLVIEAETGKVMQKMNYNELGEVTYDKRIWEFDPILFGYMGGIYDRDTKFVNFASQYYDPLIGQVIGGFPAQPDFTNYVSDDPAAAYFEKMSQIIAAINIKIFFMTYSFYN